MWRWKEWRGRTARQPGLSLRVSVQCLDVKDLVLGNNSNDFIRAVAKRVAIALVAWFVAKNLKRTDLQWIFSPNENNSESRHG